MLVPLVLQWEHVDLDGYNTCSCPAAKALKEICHPGTIITVRMANLTIELGKEFVTIALPDSMRYWIGLIDQAFAEKDIETLKGFFPSFAFRLEIPEQFLK